MNSEQIIYINLDDSGKLTSKEKVSCYGGIVFLSKDERAKFIVQYRSIIEQIRCSYCKCSKRCKNLCPEVKNHNIKSSHKRRLINLTKKNMTIGVVIDNKRIYKHILNDKASRGRYSDYCLKLLIKTLVKKLIINKRIDPYKPLKLIIDIDQQTTKSNGYYDLKNGIYEELKHGISNFNYARTFKPLLYSDLMITLMYKDSSKNYLIQASDLLAGTVRGIALKNYPRYDASNYKDFNLIVFFP